MSLLNLFKNKLLKQHRKAKTTLMEDAINSKDWIAKGLTSSGYCADFTLASLEEIDRFITDNMDDTAHSPKSGGLLAENTGIKVFALGSYVGEVIIKNCGGEWITDDNDEQGEVNIAVKIPPDSMLWPAQKVMKRILNGPEDAVYPYVVAIIKT